MDTKFKTKEAESLAASNSLLPASLAAQLTANSAEMLKPESLYLPQFKLVWPIQAADKRYAPHIHKTVLQAGDSIVPLDDPYHITAFATRKLVRVDTEKDDGDTDRERFFEGGKTGDGYKKHEPAAEMFPEKGTVKVHSGFTALVVVFKKDASCAWAALELTKSQINYWNNILFQADATKMACALIDTVDHEVNYKASKKNAKFKSYKGLDYHIEELTKDMVELARSSAPEKAIQHWYEQ